MDGGWGGRKLGKQEDKRERGLGLAYKIINKIFRKKKLESIHPTPPRNQFLNRLHNRTWRDKAPKFTLVFHDPSKSMLTKIL